MPRSAAEERQISAIPRAPGPQLPDPLQLELDQVAAGRLDGRDRAPKLSPRTRTRKMRRGISGP